MMADLRTTFTGVELKNPIIRGFESCGRSQRYQKIERAGIAAIVYRSLSKNRLTWNRFS